MPILIYLLIVCVCGMRVAASWTPVWSDDTFSVDVFFWGTLETIIISTMGNVPHDLSWKQFDILLLLTK